MAIFVLPTTKKLSAWLSTPGRVHRGWVDNQGIHPRAEPPWCTATPRVRWSGVRFRQTSDVGFRVAQPTLKKARRLRWMLCTN